MEFAKNVTNYLNDQNAVELLLSVLTDPIKNRKLSNINYAHVGNPSLIAFHQNIHHKPHVTLHSG